MATGNHFWLDVVAGVIVAAIAGALIYRSPFRRRRATAAAA
jgi:membrane-associated phospholipid phosphatase